PQGIGIEGGSARTSLINAGQTVSFDLTFEASPDAPLGVHELQGLAFRTLDRQVQRNLDHFLSLHLPIAKGFRHRLGWAPASDFAIARDPAKNAWLSGHVNAIIPVSDGAVLVGTQMGGVWAVMKTGQAFPHSNDWDNPDVTCLAGGPNGLNHF